MSPGSVPLASDTRILAWHGRQADHMLLPLPQVLGEVELPTNGVDLKTRKTAILDEEQDSERSPP